MVGNVKIAKTAKIVEQVTVKTVTVVHRAKNVFVKISVLNS